MAANVIFLPVQEVSDGKDILNQSMIYREVNGEGSSCNRCLMAYLQNRFHFMKKCVIWPYLLGFLFLILPFLSFPVLLWDSPTWSGDLVKDSSLSLIGFIHNLQYSLWYLTWEQEWNQLLSDAEGHQSCQIFHVSATLLAGSGTRSGYRQEKQGTEMNRRWRRNCSHSTTFPTL